MTRFRLAAFEGFVDRFLSFHARFDVLLVGFELICCPVHFLVAILVRLLVCLTPLVGCIRLGFSNRSIVIVVVGYL